VRDTTGTKTQDVPFIKTENGMFPNLLSNTRERIFQKNKVIAPDFSPATDNTTLSVSFVSGFL